VARLSKATMRPSVESAGNPLLSFAWVPSEATLTRSVTSAPTGGTPTLARKPTARAATTRCGLRDTTRQSQREERLA